ncbi:UNVERIFIED_CONTAM: hypothetical protein FKN15_012959 [Acipenser sinensis]
MNWTEESKQSYPQVPYISGNCCRRAGKLTSFLLKLVNRMPRVCEAVIKAKGGYFEESKI